MLSMRRPIRRLLPTILLLGGLLSTDVSAQNIEGVKYEDLNYNGIHDAGEPGLAGWTIRAYNTTTSQITSATTNASGNYVLPLVSGTWIVYEVQQTNWTQTAPTSVGYTITVGGLMPPLDFGNITVCEEPYESSTTAGIEDDFGGGNREEMSASDELLNAVTYSTVGDAFDGDTGDRAFAHTFTNVVPDGCYVVGARLIMQIRALEGAPDNDALHFTADGVNIWRTSITDYVGYPWVTGSTDVLVFNLANLPDDGSGITNILAALQDGDFDVWGQDDTSIDYMRLEVDYCCAPTGLKFNDLNHNGALDANEPGLAGWTINAYNPATQQITTATTDINGRYAFPTLGNGTWAIYETQQNGWAQTMPTTVGYLVVVPDDLPLPLMNFGNTAFCNEPTTSATLAGIPDLFLQFGNEQMTPSAELLGAVTYGGGTVTVFDNQVSNRAFAHTFSEFLPDGCYVTGATLTMRIRALAGGSDNDVIRFTTDGINIWRLDISDFLNTSWTAGSTTTLTLDIANLPDDGSGITNLIAVLQDGDFDVWGQDDTSVDFMQLRISYCCDDPQPKQGTGNTHGSSGSTAVPNPFSDQTDLTFALPHEAYTRVVIYDIYGNTIRTFEAGNCAAGNHTIRWDGRNALGASVNNGVYFYQIEAAGFRSTGKLVLQR